MNNKFIQYSLFFKYIVKKLIYIPLNCIIFFFMHFDIIKRNLKFAENLQAVGNWICFVYLCFDKSETCQIYRYIIYVYERGYMSVEKVYLQKCFDRQIKGRHTAIIFHSLFDARTSMYSSSSFFAVLYKSFKRPAHDQ